MLLVEPNHLLALVCAEIFRLLLLQILFLFFHVCNQVCFNPKLLCDQLLSSLLAYVTPLRVRDLENGLSEVFFVFLAELLLLDCEFHIPLDALLQPPKDKVREQQYPE